MRCYSLSGSPKAERLDSTHILFPHFPGSSHSTNRCKPFLKDSIYDQQYLTRTGDNEPHLETLDRSREVTAKEKLHLHYNSPCETDFHFKILYQQDYSFCVFICICWPHQFFSVSVHGKGNWTLSGCTHIIKRIYLFYLSSRLQILPALISLTPTNFISKSSKIMRSDGFW